MNEANQTIEAIRRGQQAMQAGRYDEAVRAFQEAIRLVPEVDGLYFQYASALLWRGLPAEALHALDHCVRLDGVWARHAAELAMQVRRQLSLPLFGQMLLPVAAAVQSRRTS